MFKLFVNMCIGLFISFIVMVSLIYFVRHLDTMSINQEVSSPTNYKEVAKIWEEFPECKNQAFEDNLLTIKEYRAILDCSDHAKINQIIKETKENGNY